MKIEITNDVYNISQRIKEIDENYYVLFNTIKGAFEIHNSSQIGSSYCLTLPFEELDERTLQYVRKTQSDNIDEILENLKQDNNILESANKTSAFSFVVDFVEQFMEK